MTAKRKSRRTQSRRSSEPWNPVQATLWIMRNDENEADRQGGLFVDEKFDVRPEAIPLVIGGEFNNAARLLVETHLRPIPMFKRIGLLRYAKREVMRKFPAGRASGTTGRPAKIRDVTTFLIEYTATGAQTEEDCRKAAIAHFRGKGLSVPVKNVWRPAWGDRRIRKLSRGNPHSRKPARAREVKSGT